MDALVGLDAEGAPDHAWMERCRLLERVRAHAEAAPIRRRMRERAEPVEAAYLAPA